jgi:hypothetical protein
MDSTQLHDARTLTLRNASVGAGTAAIVLVAMAFISLPGGMTYPGMGILDGRVILKGAELQSYLGSMRLLFVLDGVFLLGWIIAWTGLAALVQTRAPAFGALVLAFGLVGALLDLTENGIILGALEALEAGQAAPGTWTIVWKAVQHLSYWLPFASALHASTALWSKRPLDRITAFTGSVLLIFAVPGLYFPGFSLLSNAWFLIWFTSLAALLWQRANDMIRTQKQEG